MEPRKAARKRTVDTQKRALILDAARTVFEEDGLEGASVRSIAARAGYTAAALYFHFASKEAIYAALLERSLAALGEAVRAAIDATVADARPADRLLAAGMGFFGFYAANPRDLDLGFYLFRGGMKPHGLGREHDLALNAALADALRPVAMAAMEMGATAQEADLLTVDVFAHASGLLLLLHTGRIRMFGAKADALMQNYLAMRIEQLHARAVSP